MSQPLNRMRLLGFLQKERLQILRDPSSILLAIVMPLVLLFLFGYGVSLDAEDVPVALVCEDSGRESRDLLARFDHSRYFHPVRCPSMTAAKQLLDQGTVDGIVRMRSNFSERVQQAAVAAAEPPPVQLILNAVDSNRARLILGYVNNILASNAAILNLRGESPPAAGVRLEQRVWFNEGLESTHFLVPGLLTLVMTLIGVLLTALVIAREWERGTMEAILATPLRTREFMLGKLLPYLALGLLGMLLSVALGVVVFGVPFRGSVLALLATSTLFLLASLGLGLFISAAVRIQFVAAQVSIVVGFLPAFFLSGLLFDLESTPWPIQAISVLIPAKYFVTISHTLFLAGDVWSVLFPNALVLLAMAVVLLLAARSQLGLRLKER